MDFYPAPNICCRVRLEMVTIENKLVSQVVSLFYFGVVAHSSFHRMIKETMACNSLLDLTNSALACLSPAYASIDADRQPAPVDPAFMASTCYNTNFLKRPQEIICSVNKKASRVIKELQNYLDQSQTIIDRLLLENDANLVTQCYHLPVPFKLG